MLSSHCTRDAGGAEVDKKVYTKLIKCYELENQCETKTLSHCTNQFTKHEIPQILNPLWKILHSGTVGGTGMNTNVKFRLVLKCCSYIRDESDPVLFCSALRLHFVPQYITLCILTGFTHNYKYFSERFSSTFPSSSCRRPYWGGRVYNGRSIHRTSLSGLITASFISLPAICLSFRCSYLIHQH